MSAHFWPIGWSVTIFNTHTTSLKPATTAHAGFAGLILDERKTQSWSPKIDSTALHDLCDNTHKLKCKDDKNNAPAAKSDNTFAENTSSLTFMYFL